jgi:Trk K+ transport system NAD-binding subunit
MTPTYRISNEFAIVTVAVVENSRGTVLEIRSEESGRSIRLDALELEALAGIDHRDLDVFVLRTTQAAVDLRNTEGQEQPP